MRGLLKSEFRRLLSRRMTLGITLVFAALMLVVMVLVFLLAGDDAFLVNDLVGNGFDGGGGQGGALAFVGGFLVLAGYVLGASSIGADHKSGVLELLLTWEPRRTRLIGSRLGVGFVIAGAMGALLTTFFGALWWLFATLNSAPTNLTDNYWLDVIAVLVRTGIGVGAWFIIGLALALLVKSSVGAIVGFFIYAFILENLIGLWEAVSPWTPLKNVDGFISGEGVPDVQGFTIADSTHHDYRIAGLVMLAYVTLIAGAALLAFQKRDVT